MTARFMSATIAFGYLSEGVASGGVVDDERFSRRGVEPPAADQHLRDVPTNDRACSCKGISCGPPLRYVIERETCGLGAAHAQYRN